VAIETPKYDILQKNGIFEIRKYQGYISASVEIESDFRNALGKGFGILADYIFGNNRAKTSIQMTAPVTEQKVRSKKIEMTAPVTSGTLREGQRYLISFTMPSKYDIQDLPEPVNKTITIHKIEPHKAVVVKFSGYLNEKTAAKKTQELEAWIKKNHLDYKHGFTIAQYNPPWIPGPFRRNEIIATLD
jgi:hypothetical protein